MASCVLAFDFGGTRARCALVGRDGSRLALEVRDRPAEADGRGWLERMIQAARELRAAHPEHAPLAIGVSFGGPVGTDGRIHSMHVSGWEHVDLAGMVSSEFSLPCAVDNDANLGAYGEYRYAPDVRGRDLAYFTVSTGVGGGFVWKGKPFRGAHGLAAEFGHIPVCPDDPSAPVCACGKRGCVESLASGRAIELAGREALQAAGREAAEGFNAGDVFAAAGRGEAWARPVRDRAVGALAWGVASILCVLDLPLVVLGGGVTQAGEALFEPLRARIEGYLPLVLRGRAEVRPAALGQFSPLLGAAALAWDRLDAEHG